MEDVKMQGMDLDSLKILILFNIELEKNEQSDTRHGSRRQDMEKRKRLATTTTHTIHMFNARV
jgi:hypothetical protein